MKNKKLAISIISAAAVILAAAGILLGMHLWRSHRLNTMVEQQNFLASKLLEMGEYEEGRIMAAQCEQMSENVTSERLLVLSAGFQADYEVGLLYVEQYLKNREDKVMASAGEIYREVLDTLELVPRGDAQQYNEMYNAQLENVREKLKPLLLQVQSGISAKKAGDGTLAMLDLLTGTGVTSEALALLEEDDSLLSQKIQVSHALQTGDYEQAYKKAEVLFNQNDSFENRALLANLAAENEAFLTEDRQAEGLKERQETLRQEQGRLRTQHAQETDAARQDDINQKIEEVQTQIDRLQQEIDAIPAQKAINFIETTTPIKERDTVSFKIELARLYYQASQRDRAKELLMEVIQGEGPGTEHTGDIVKISFSDFLNGYIHNNGSAENMSYESVENVDLEVLWNRVAKLLGFIEKEYHGDDLAEDSFYDFVLNNLNRLYNGLIIRRIDATGFPTVRVTVNVPMELERALQKSDFALEEQGAPLTVFELLNTEDLEETGDLSVALVVDRSGSMSGSRMEDTQRAVTNFVKTIDESIEVGLIAFDNMAQVVTPMGNGRNSVLQGINSLSAVGGTSIYSGLQLAGQELEGKSGRRVVILLSDGEDGNPNMIDEVLDDLKRKNIYVYAIGVGGADTEYLSYIARKCDGKFIQADSSEVLGEIYSAIGQYMVNDYVIEFTAVTDPENFSRKIRVTLDVDDAFSEREYNVGVPYEAIEAEQNERPLADYFQQVGGSNMEPETGAEE